ncbi:MAG: DNA methyltransferase [Dehalococcoidia bacterium]
MSAINHYVEWMKERVIEMWRVLKDTGTLYLHCDWHASHHLKVMLDDVLGVEHFQNEIIWHYRGGGVSPRRFGRRQRGEPQHYPEHGMRVRRAAYSGMRAGEITALRVGNVDLMRRTVRIVETAVVASRQDCAILAGGPFLGCAGGPLP